MDEGESDLNQIWRDMQLEMSLNDHIVFGVLHVKQIQKECIVKECTCALIISHYRKKNFDAVLRSCFERQYL